MRKLQSIFKRKKKKQNQKNKRFNNSRETLTNLEQKQED